MGQGAESCGGYDVEYDALADAPDGVWIQANGVGIRITQMALSHLQNARRFAERKAETATFTDDADRWRVWVDLFDEEIILRRAEQRAAKTAVVLSSAVLAGQAHTTTSVARSGGLLPAATRSQTVARGAKVTMVCHCGQRYEARTADVKRGWGLSCSKRCAAIRRDFGRPAARRATD